MELRDFRYAIRSLKRSPGFVAVAVLSTGAGGEVHWADQIGLMPGATSVWNRGGTLGSLLWDLKFSDDSGTTWTPVRNYTAVTPPNVSQQVTVLDYEAPPAAYRWYRAHANLLVPPLTSAWDTISVIPPVVGTRWLIDPLSPERSLWIRDRGTETTYSYTKGTQVAHALGRAVALWDEDVIQGVTMDLDLIMRTQAEWDAFGVLWRSQRVLLLKGDQPGENWYVTLGPTLKVSTLSSAARASAPVRTVQFSATEADAP